MTAIASIIVSIAIGFAAGAVVLIALAAFVGAALGDVATLILEPSEDGQKQAPDPDRPAPANDTDGFDLPPAA